MIRTFLILMIVIVELPVGQVACGRSPDEVANSLIPPLRVPPAREGPAAQNVLFPIPPAAPTRTLQPGYQAPQRGPVTAKTTGDRTEGDHTEESDAERLEIWNSPEMLEARAYVAEFSRRSARTSLAEGEQFLARLSQLSSEEMRSWLKRYQALRTNISREREVDEWARELTWQRAIERQEAARRASENVKNLRGQAAAASQEHYLTPPHDACQLKAAQAMQRGGALALQPSYDPLDPEFDPVNPHGHERRRAAAISLLGDLPRNDPRNFMRGYRRADYGEWGITRSNEPPAQLPGNSPLSP